MELLALSIFLSVLVYNAVTLYIVTVDSKNTDKRNQYLSNTIESIIKLATASTGINISDIIDNTVNSKSKEISDEIVDNLNLIIKSKNIDLLDLIKYMKLNYSEFQEKMYSDPGNLTPLIAEFLNIDEADLYASNNEIQRKYGHE